MFDVVLVVRRIIGAAFQRRDELVLENLALRHRLTVLQRHARRPRFRRSDRLRWVFLRAVWSRWEKALVIVRPQMVVSWHRAGFRMFWRWKSRRPDGRPSVDRKLIELIRQMWRANPTWGSPRIRDELGQTGLPVSVSTVRNYRPKTGRPPSQTWKTFLRNHAKQIATIDFFMVSTAPRPPWQSPVPSG